jgi:hypothetical protein
MATKLTVALVGGIVIVVSIAILIIETLTSPSRCKPRSETSQTEENLLHKTEPVSSPSTILSPRTNFPPHSTPQPGTVLSTVSAVDVEVTSPANFSTTIDSGTTSVEQKNIIIVPPRNCPSGQKRDKFGVCRHKW